MTNDEKRTRIEEIVREFTVCYVTERLLWQLGQIFPGVDVQSNQVADFLEAVYGKDVAGALGYTLEPQEWLQMALYGAGLADGDPHEIYQVCQTMAEWIFAVPGHNAYEIPSQWAETDMGGLWWAAYIRTEGDELITIAQAAETAGVSVQAVSQRIDRGSLKAFIDPLAPERQGRRLVRRRDVARAP